MKARLISFLVIYDLPIVIWLGAIVLLSNPHSKLVRTQQKIIAKMLCHPPGDSVDIVGICARNQGRSCECHRTCGEVVKEDVVVRFRRVQVVVKGKEETAIAVYWVTEGIDRCRVGFLPRHLTMRAHRYDDVLAQVVGVYGSETDNESKYVREKAHKNKGFAEAIIISKMGGVEKEDNRKKRKADGSNDDSSDSGD